MYSILFACLPVWFQMLQWNLNVLQVIYERVFFSKFVYQRNFVIHVYLTKLAGIDAHRLCFRCVVLWLGLLFISFITNLWIQSLFCIYLTSICYFNFIQYCSTCNFFKDTYSFKCQCVLYWLNKSNFQTLLQNPYLPEKLSRTIIEQQQKASGNNLEPAVCGIYQPTISFDS